MQQSPGTLGYKSVDIYAESDAHTVGVIECESDDDVPFILSKEEKPSSKPQPVVVQVKKISDTKEENKKVDKPQIALPPPDEKIFDFDLDGPGEKPWNREGAERSDYFNYGFDANTWQEYVKSQVRLRRAPIDNPRPSVHGFGHVRTYQTGTPAEVTAGVVGKSRQISLRQFSYQSPSQPLHSLPTHSTHAYPLSTASVSSLQSMSPSPSPSHPHPMAPYNRPKPMSRLHLAPQHHTDVHYYSPRSTTENVSPTNQHKAQGHKRRHH